MKNMHYRKGALAVTIMLVFSMLLTACGDKSATSSGTGSAGSETSANMSAESGQIDAAVSDGQTLLDGTSQSGGTSTLGTSSKGTASSGGGNGTSKGNKYGLPEINVTNKKLRLYTGPEKKLEDYKSKTSLPGALEIAKEVYGIDLELVSCGDYNEWYSKQATLVLSGNAPDIAYPPSESFPYDIVKNNIIPLDKEIDFSLSMWKGISSLQNEYSWNNVHYHAVISEGKQMQPVYYNPQIFRANGVKTPKELMAENNWTWDTMREAAVELTLDTNGDGVIDQWGIGGMFFTAMQESTGKRLVEVKGKDVKLNISDPVFAKAAQYIYDLGPKGKYKCATAFSHDNAEQYFPNGKAAMDVGSLWRATETYRDMWKKGTIDLVPFPKMDKNSEYYAGGVPATLVIYRGAKNKEAAKAFIYSARYVESEEYEKMFAEQLKKEKPMSWLKEYGLTDEQIATVNSMYDSPYSSNPNTWIGWLDNGWDCGLQYAHEKQWSSILNLYTTKFTNTIKSYKETLDIFTES